MTDYSKIHVESNNSQDEKLQSYYRFHSMLYDKTRWIFLFGRQSLVHQLPLAQDNQFSMLEIGVGTGYNLYNFAAYFKAAKLTGVDLSKDMIGRAKQKLKHFDSRIQLINKTYKDSLFKNKEGFDVVLFSYMLSMTAEHYKTLVYQAYRDLKPGGLIIVVDFHNTSHQFFEKHMQNNHVCMQGHLLPYLKQHFGTLSDSIQPAYWGLWKFFTFVGIKPYTFTK